MKETRESYLLHDSNHIFFSHIVLVNSIFYILMPQLEPKFQCLVINVYKHTFRDQEIFSHIQF